MDLKTKTHSMFVAMASTPRGNAYIELPGNKGPLVWFGQYPVQDFKNLLHRIAQQSKQPVKIVEFKAGRVMHTVQPGAIVVTDKMPAVKQ